MTTMSAPTVPSTPFTPTSYDTAGADTLELPRPTRAVADRQSTGLVLDATRLWTGGLATAAVAAHATVHGYTVAFWWAAAFFAARGWRFDYPPLFSA